MSHSPQARTALITGANSGIGLELTKRLLSEGWGVVALTRSPFADDEREISDARAAGQLRVYHADFSDFTRLRQALGQIGSREESIDVLFNNAAASVGELRRSPAGHELHFAVNTVAPYIVLMELRPLLARGALKTVVNTSSNALLFVKQFTLETLEHPARYKPLTGPYGASKLGLSLWSQALAPALLAEGVEIRSVNPGGTKTKMTASASMPRWLLPIRHLFFAHPRVGARRLYDAALGQWRGQTGVFLNNDRATPVTFAREGPRVLERVHAIYQEALAG